MYADHQPCAVCGSPVRLAPHTPETAPPDAVTGPADGVVGTADPTVDDRICTNASCPTNGDDPARTDP